MAKWAVCALLGIAALGIAARYESPNVWSELVGIGIFTLCYGAAIFAAFREYRNILLKFFSALAQRLREQFG